MDSPPFGTVCREVIKNWRRLTELADFAERRHGYGNSNGGFGITYPGDLDEHDIATGCHIPEGSVEVYAYTSAIPPGYEIVIPEMSYLRVLADVLRENRLSDEADRVLAILARA